MSVCSYCSVYTVVWGMEQRCQYYLLIINSLTQIFYTYTHTPLIYDIPFFLIFCLSLSPPLLLGFLLSSNVKIIPVKVYLNNELKTHTAQVLVLICNNYYYYIRRKIPGGKLLQFLGHLQVFSCI